MADRLDASGTPHPSEQPGARAQSRGRLWVPVLIALSLILVCGYLLVPRPGVPDPFFQTSVTYTPAQGPASPVLLDSRPELVAQRYLADYLQLAHTYPCVADLTAYDDSIDPVLDGEACTVTRPVATDTVTAVTIQAHGLLSRPFALVHVLITYADGSQWASIIGLVPYSFQHQGLTYIHLDCWSSLGTLRMFGHLVPDVPPGADYSPHDGQYVCKQ